MSSGYMILKMKMKMKNIVLWTLVVAMCLLVETEANCKYEDEDLTVGKHFVNCIQVECHSDGHITGLPCPLYQCQEGKQVGYRPKDVTKPFPECCEGPICKD